MRVRFWGTRGSVATPGPETIRYGGDTSCVEVRCGREDHMLVLDAGTGLRRLGDSLAPAVTRVDLFLTHLHLDHIIGLGFFAPLFRPDVAVTIWAPPSPSATLLQRLGRYLSPPLFPVRVRDLGPRVELRDVPLGDFECGDFRIRAEAVIHPDPAVGYRVTESRASLAYLPDHEPALGGPTFPSEPAWTSGLAVADGVDLLVHDAQYTDDEYADRVGWGHSTAAAAVDFARLAGAERLALFHHDPGHSDEDVDAILAEARAGADGLDVVAATEGEVLAVG